uniref:Uncharacterized protein n=1 Tax=Arundo donax TaxID=35708 RepID=A0A0A9FWG8_ARUDO
MRSVERWLRHDVCLMALATRILWHGMP